MNRPLRMNEVFPLWASGGGLFSAMNNPPWGNTITAQNLDFQYFGVHSGEKRVSGIVQHFAKMSPDGESLTTEQIFIIAEMVLTRFRNNWERLWYAFQADYNPIENYSMVEEESGESQRTTTNVGKVTANNDRSVSVYGYNSGEGVPADTERGNGAEDRTDNGTDDNAHSRTLTRSGNIGVTTSQQMLQSEIDLRAWEYFDRVFADVDRLLTLQIY